MQLLNSPLRVHDPKHADAIFVPTRYSFQNHEAYKQLMANLTTYLPLLGQKPHFVILGAPRQSHVNENDPLVTDPVAQQHLLYMSMVVPDFLNGDVVRVQQRLSVAFYLNVHSVSCPISSRCPTITKCTGRKKPCRHTGRSMPQPCWPASTTGRRTPTAPGQYTTRPARQRCMGVYTSISSA